MFQCDQSAPAFYGGFRIGFPASSARIERAKRHVS